MVQDPNLGVSVNVQRGNGFCRLAQQKDLERRRELLGVSNFSHGTDDKCWMWVTGTSKC